MKGHKILIMCGRPVEMMEHYRTVHRTIEFFLNSKWSNKKCAKWNKQNTGRCTTRENERKMTNKNTKNHAAFMFSNHRKCFVAQSHCYILSLHTVVSFERGKPGVLQIAGTKDSVQTHIPYKTFAMCKYVSALGTRLTIRTNGDDSYT